MSITIGGVSCQELNGSGAVNFTENGLEGIRILKCAWNDFMTLALALRGVRWENLGGKLFRKIVAHSWTLPDDTVLVCDRINVSGLGKSGLDETTEAIIYDFAKLDITYVPVEYNWGGEDEGGAEDETQLGDVNYNYSAEFLGTQRGTWKEDDTGNTINEPLGLLICYTELTVNLKGLPVLPKAGIRLCRGGLNDKEWQGAPKGHVLFLGGSSRRSWSTLGLSPFDLTLKFKEKSWDWNYVFGKDGTWHLVVDKKTGLVNPYDYVDFDSLFQVQL